MAPTASEASGTPDEHHEHHLLADVPPLDVSGVRTVTVGTVLFLLAGLALLPFRGWLEDTGREWWLWVCVAGVGLGLFGIDYCRRRARHLHSSA